MGEVINPGVWDNKQEEPTVLDRMYNILQKHLTEPDYEGDIVTARVGEVCVAVFSLELPWDSYVASLEAKNATPVGDGVGHLALVAKALTISHVRVLAAVVTELRYKDVGKFITVVKTDKETQLGSLALVYRNDQGTMTAIELRAMTDQEVKDGTWKSQTK